MCYVPDGSDDMSNDKRLRGATTGSGRPGGSIGT
jgi:hypothetical protein